VFIDGVFQAHDSYSVSGTTLTFSTAPANTRVVTVYHARSSISGSNMIVDTMTGDNSDVTLTLSVAPVSENNVQVYFDGVYQSKANYSISGTTLTFSTAPATGVAVEAITHTQTTINEPAANTVTPAKIAAGDFYFDTDTLYIDSTNNNVGIGTASPARLLETVATNAGADITAFQVRNNNSSTSTSTSIRFVNSTSGTSTAGGGEISAIRNASDGGALTFKTAADSTATLTERIRILSGGGITFNGDTAAANALDDYEEGTFTVTATPSVSGTVTLSSVNVGYYTKIGNRVFFNYRVDVASVSSPSGRLNINLPFTVADISPSSSSRSTATTFIYNSVSTNIGDFVSFIPTGTSFVSIYVGSTATGSNTSANQMQSGTEIHVAGHYITN
jgi:hypothetical protein